MRNYKVCENDPYNFLRPFNFCHNFRLILSKIEKLHFLESTLKCLKIGQKWYPCDLPIRNNGSLKFWTNLLFHGHFSCKIRKFKYWFWHYLKIQAKELFFWKIQVKLTIYREIKGRRTCYFVSPKFSLSRSY